MRKNPEPVPAHNIMLQQQSGEKAMVELHKKLLAEGYQLSPAGEYVKTVVLPG